MSKKSIKEYLKQVYRAMRAVAQDRVMASLLSINIDAVIVMTFIIGSALAAVAGSMGAMNYSLVNYSIGRA